MKDTLALHLFQSLSAKEVLRFGKFLQSPYFNHRTDVQALFRVLAQNVASGTSAAPEKKEVFAIVYPEKSWDRLQFNYLAGFFVELLEQFMACEDLLSDRLQNRLFRCRAFRKRGLSRHFEKNAAELQRQHHVAPHRNAGFWLFEYQLQNEIFSHQVLQSGGKQTNLAAVTEGLTNFYLLEHLKWAGATRSLQSYSRQALPPLPLSEAVLATVEAVDEHKNPALSLMHAGLTALREPENEENFSRLKTLLRTHRDLFPSAERRDLYMTAINFAIRRHNRGERPYTLEAFELYREALELGILHENGLLPKHTYINVQNLAQLTGAHDWALHFLESSREALPPAERDNIYRYALAGFHFRHSDYREVLELLREVEFSDIFIQLDARKMLLRSYFELGEWLSLASLLDSFKAFLLRQKNLGYHRESYLSLVKFTKKLAKTVHASRSKRTALARHISLSEAVAEREWLLEKLER
ncbi:MAG: hypothetical protein IT262_23900 [Saprospiraceae bacterium]|nr:hypothetical protein [Saprospiraceae bacterium]